ncbi:hypothetical protein NLJ89_g4807 [Agrocybe chaxingu]|uniref:Uncharacterized protein n=1 Tax=Agrocybe chaxingu TaxID=84603 RepID=A0A9W8K275_9AGAR|nr:hypothetical protein NLJ89_g4807 [Agrocybe chaxingu]
MTPLPSATRYNNCWIQRPCWQFDESESITDEEDDYAWYYTHPERYIWRPRRSRRPASLKNGVEFLLEQRWNSRSGTPTLDARSTPSTQSSGLSSLASSEISESPCLGPPQVEGADGWQAGSYPKAATRIHGLSSFFVDPCLAGDQSKLSAEYGQQESSFLSAIKQWHRIPLLQFKINSL